MIPVNTTEISALTQNIQKLEWDVRVVQRHPDEIEADRKIVEKLVKKIINNINDTSIFDEIEKQKQINEVNELATRLSKLKIQVKFSYYQSYAEKEACLCAYRNLRAHK